MIMLSGCYYYRLFYLKSYRLLWPLAIFIFVGLLNSVQYLNFSIEIDNLLMKRDRHENSREITVDVMFYPFFVECKTFYDYMTDR